MAPYSCEYTPKKLVFRYPANQVPPWSTPSFPALHWNAWLHLKVKGFFKDILNWSSRGSTTCSGILSDAAVAARHLDGHE